MPDEKFILITSARNEANYLGKTIESVVSQTILPAAWVIVDDGSSDATASTAAKASRLHPWIKVISREDRGYGDHEFGAVEGFYYGLNHLDTDDFDFIFLIDGDVVIKPHYFEIILQKFADNPHLGIAEGQVQESRNGKLVSLISMPWSTCGQIKCWRRRCFQEIAGLVRAPGWDSIDNYKAMMLGWQTRTFTDEELKILHLRPMGWSFKSIPHSLVRSGNALYYRGTHPLWLLATAGYNMITYPYVLGGLWLILGYLQALFKRSPQYPDKNFISYLRKWQINKLYQILRSRCI
jgi:biofilm PGA synthesis N-glycosyltransferase PgaC